MKKLKLHVFLIIFFICISERIRQIQETKIAQLVSKRKNSIDNDDRRKSDELSKNSKRNKSNPHITPPLSSNEGKPKDEVPKDKVRRVAQEYFENTIAEIFKAAERSDSIKSNISLDNPREFAVSIEKELFAKYSIKSKSGTLECGPNYSAKYRNIQYNLKDKKNDQLRRRILTGEITPMKLVQMSPEDMANDEVKLRTQEIRNRTLLQTIKSSDDSVTLLKKTHKGEVEVNSHENDIPTMRINEQPTPIQEPTKIQTLDEILAKMDGRKDPINDDSENDWKEWKAEDTSNHFEAENIEDNQFITQTEAGDIILRSPSLSPMNSPKSPSSKEDAFVWKGKVYMPQVGKFNGYCRQVAGRKVGDSKSWEDVLPVQISIDGRIATSKVAEYVLQQKGSSSKEVVVVEFKADGTNEDDEGFATLFDYFDSKDRCAVIGHHYVSIKDMYIFPLTPQAPIPEFLRELELNNRIPTDRSENVLLGVIVLVKHFFIENHQKHHSTTKKLVKHSKLQSQTIKAEPMRITSHLPYNPPLNVPATTVAGILPYFHTPSTTSTIFPPQGLASLLPSLGLGQAQNMNASVQLTQLIASLAASQAASTIITPSPASAPVNSAQIQQMLAFLAQAKRT
ncbi:PHD finger protein 3 [Nowakowskiella sp. JEL0078]|nr:PHD finger protein 3 [Nowakowskiella sp. JEL0078]